MKQASKGTLRINSFGYTILLTYSLKYVLGAQHIVAYSTYDTTAEVLLFEKQTKQNWSASTSMPLNFVKNLVKFIFYYLETNGQ